MTDRKKDRKKEFHHDPFKRLKGFCVPTPEKGAEVATPVQPKGPQDEAALFAGEMERLGVDRNTEEKGIEDREEASPLDPLPENSCNPPVTDRELFLSALGRMETFFADGIPEADGPGATPRRMRQVRRGELVPEAELDLHGLNRDEARTRVRNFLDNASYQGLKTVLIITGRGKGSGGEAVVRTEIERYLKYEAAAWVVEWGRAPARHGGEGALVLFLKGRKGR